MKTLPAFPSASHCAAPARLMRTCLGALVLATLAACGGSGGSSLTINGAAATGAAVVSGTVSVVCKSGTGTATTRSDGKYTVVVDNGTGPCIVTVTSGSLVLRSITAPSGSGGLVANVTPISDAIVTGLLVAKGVPQGANQLTQLVTQAAYVPTSSDISSLNTSVLNQINTVLANKGQTTLPPGTDLLGDSNFAPPVTPGGNADKLDAALDYLFTAQGTESQAVTGLVIGPIANAVDAVVAPNPTGGTGATGGN